MEEQKKKINGISEGALKTLQKEFVVIGKTRVHSWTAWLIIGLLAGATAGILYVANRSGEFEAGEAKTQVQRFSDNFNRRDSKTLGRGWKVITGTLEIASNELRTPEKLPEGEGAYAIQPKITGENQTVSARFAFGRIDKGSFPQAGLILRFNGIFSNYYLYRQAGDEGGRDKDPRNDSKLAIGRVVEIGEGTGEGGDVASVLVPNPQKDQFFELTAKAEGNVLTLLLDGKEYLSIKDDSLSSGAVGLFMSSTKRNTVHRADDFKAVVSTEVAPKSSIKVLSPNGGEVWQIGNYYDIKWSALNFPVDSTVYIELRSRGPIDSPASKLAVVSPANGSYSWLVPNDIIPGQYIIEIYKADKNGNIDPNESVKDISDAPFSIVASPSITVIYPNGGEVWQKETTQIIKWVNSAGGGGGGGGPGPGEGVSSKSCVSCAAPPQGCNYEGASCETCGTLICGEAPPNPPPPPVPPIETVSINLLPYHPPCKVEPCPLFPQIIYPIASATTNDGSFEWKVGTASGSTVPNGDYLVEVANNITGASDISDAPFSIVAAAPFLKISASSNHPTTIIRGMANQKLGAILLDVANEPAVVSAATFGISVSNQTGTGTLVLQPGDITNITLVDSSGIVVAGPIDPFADGLGAPRFTFKDIFTVKTGRNEYFLQGNLGAGSTLPEGSKIRFITSTPRQWNATGQISGNPAIFPALPVTVITTPVQIVNGSLSVVLDATTPSQRMVAAGETKVELSRLRLNATNEPLLLSQIALQLSDTGLNSPDDLIGKMVTLWDGTTKIAEATFVSGDYALAKIAIDYVVPKDSSRTISVKGDIAGIGISGPLTASGDLLKVDWDGDGAGSPTGYRTSGVGLSSGREISASGPDTTSAGVRIMKSYPLITIVPKPSFQPVNGIQVLHRFSINANTAGHVGIARVTYDINVVNASTSEFKLYVYSDPSFSQSVQQFGSSDSGERVRFDLERLQIPAGVTRYFELRGNVSVGGSDSYVSASLRGDSAFAGMDTVDAIKGTDFGNFIWSPNSLKTSVYSDKDWVNGYLIPGLPTK